MKFDKRDLLLYAVTDRKWLRGQTLAQQVEQALKGGATLVQLREKQLSEQAFLAQARVIKALCERYAVPFIINDNVEIALAVDADGVHVGQSDMAAGDVRSRLGAGKILGVSAQTVEQALIAEQQGADYLGVGAVFPTLTKPDAVYTSHQTLQAICQAVRIPVVAIGGISAANVTQLAGSGICGVAVINAIFEQENIEQASRRLRAIVADMLN